MMSIVATLALSSALIGSCVDPDAAQRGGASVNATLMPRDEGPRRPDFAAFRQRLLIAVGRRDVDAILMAADPGIRVDFGGGGLDRFRALISDPASNFWSTFADALNLGGTFTAPDTFAAPYVYSAWPDALDSFECVAVTGAGVRLRSRPEPNGRMLATLAYDIVERVEERPSPFPGWTRVRLANGVEGYIASRFVRSPVDHRAIFTLTTEGWRLTAFVAGD